MNKKLPDIKIFKNIISLGHFCEVTEMIQQAGYRLASYPLDWVMSSSFELVLSLINNDFKDFLNKNYLYQSNSNRDHYINIKYSIEFFHDFSKYKSLDEQLPNVVEKYTRRNSRFIESTKSPTLFVRYVFDQQELDYIKTNLNYITEVIKKNNHDNDIIFISNKGLLIPNEIVDCTFTVEPGKDDLVCRHILSANKSLEKYIKSASITPNVLSIEKNKKVQKNKYPNYIVLTHRRIKKLFKLLFLKKYKHHNAI